MTSQTILIVDDEQKIITLLQNALEDEGFVVHGAATVEQVHRVLGAQKIDLITLDIILGARSGIDLARDIRRTSQVPIIMVTGKNDVIDRVVGLEVGADDYITKPFHIREVLARIRSVLRRSINTNAVPQEARGIGPEAAHFCFDGLTAIPDHLELVDRQGEDSPLTAGDFKLLVVFLTNAKRILSRDQLMDMTGGIEWSPLDRTIDNQVARLRKKIERDPGDPKLIKTVRGIGYTFASDVHVVQASGLTSKRA